MCPSYKRSVYLFPTLTSPNACTFSQIMRSESSRLPLAVLKASASIVRGAPRTTSGAPYSGVRIACSRVSPPTALKDQLGWIPTGDGKSYQFYRQSCECQGQVNGFPIIQKIIRETGYALSPLRG